MQKLDWRLHPAQTLDVAWDTLILKKKTQVFVVYLKFNLAPVFLFAVSDHPTLKAIIPPLRAVRSEQPRALSGVPSALSSWERSEWHQQASGNSERPPRFWRLHCPPSVVHGSCTSLSLALTLISSGLMKRWIYQDADEAELQNAALLATVGIQASLFSILIPFPVSHIYSVPEELPCHTTG